MPGPSPRARGAAVERLRHRRPRGVIPACTGSRVATSSAPRRCWGHPRVCGEQYSEQDPEQPGWGSSPRAGSRDLRRWRCPRGGGHPRVRGEQAYTGGVGDDVKGPSPRVRGAEGRSERTDQSQGSIPASAGSRDKPGAHVPQPRAIPVRAGSSSASSPPGTPSRVHPRVPGEQVLGRTFDTPLKGPSPRAGSRTVHRSPPSSTGVHPRVRGEQCAFRQSSHMNWGPSLRARGAVFRRLLSAMVVGSIPARAGSSDPGHARSGSPRGHPRVCGEQVSAGITLSPMKGPSPCARGAVHGFVVILDEPGSIPA